MFKNNRSRKTIMTGVAAIAVGTAFAAASAATLGGMSTEQVGAEDAVVAACDSDGIDVAYLTSYDAGLGEYAVTGVEVSDIDANCVGQQLSVTLADVAGNALQSVGGQTVASTSETLAVTAVNADLIEGVSVLITG